MNDTPDPNAATATASPLAPVTAAPHTYRIAQSVPQTGYFTGRFAIAGRGPAVLRGPNKEVASAIHSSSESTIYAFDALAEQWGNLPVLPRSVADGDRNLEVPWQVTSDPVPPFAAHPFTLAHLGDLSAVLSIDGPDGEVLDAPRFRRLLSTSTLQRFFFEWFGAKHYACAWVDVEARAPWTHWSFMVRRRDGQVGGSVVAIWPNVNHELGVISFGSLLTRAITLLSLDETHNLGSTLIENHNSFYGVQADWAPTLLGLPLSYGTPNTRERCADIASDRMTAFAGRQNPNAGGVDESFGPSYTGVVWSKNSEGKIVVEPGVIDALVMSASMWAKRPCHWLEPGTTQILRYVPTRPLTLWTGQPFTRAEADTLQLGLQYRGVGGADAIAYDEEHRSVAPLALACVLTGEPLLLYIADSFLAHEVYSRSVREGYVQPGRGQGNPWIAGELLARVTTDPHLISAWGEHVQTRIRQYRTRRLPHGQGYIGGTYERGSPWTCTAVAGANTGVLLPLSSLVFPGPATGKVSKGDKLQFPSISGSRGMFTVVNVPEDNAGSVVVELDRAPDFDTLGLNVSLVAPYWDGYEQGILVVALYLSGFYAEAVEHGKALLTSCYWTGGYARSAYNVRYMGGDWPYGFALEKRDANPEQKPAGAALGMWASSGIRCMLLAMAKLGQTDMEIELFARTFLYECDKAIEDIGSGELLCAMNRAMLGAVV